MTTIRPRHPLLGIVRLLALIWTLLSLLGLGFGVLAVLYAGAWGCVGHHLGWFGCMAATTVIPFAAVSSLFVAVVVLFFAHIFYVAGAKAEDVAPRRRRSWKEKAGGFVAEVIADILT
jgi:uncharacterized BrkB/YihY/UPF0761 family membrane protein